MFEKIRIKNRKVEFFVTATTLQPKKLLSRDVKHDSNCKEITTGRKVISGFFKSR